MFRNQGRRNLGVDGRVGTHNSKLKTNASRIHVIQLPQAQANIAPVAPIEILEAGFEVRGVGWRQFLNQIPEE